MEETVAFKPMESFSVRGKRVLLRLDINSPLDPETKKIADENRLKKTAPTLAWLLQQGAKVAIIAHQGDTLDYQNLIGMAEHADRLSALTDAKVRYIDDVCGPMAQSAVENLDNGEAVLLGNVRYLAEEVSTFEDAVKLEPNEMLDTWLVRSLAPLFDLYVNEAFSAAHRNAPSMVAFQELLPSAAGPLMFQEVSALTKVMNAPDHPAVFVLGGAKISDAFGMMGQVLSQKTADTILACGVTGEVFLLAKGVDLGPQITQFLEDRSLMRFVQQAKEYLQSYPGKIEVPLDLAYEAQGEREEIDVDKLPVDELFADIGEKTVNRYGQIIEEAGTVFVNGPAGMFENKLFEYGTRELWRAISEAPGYTVVGGGDTVNAAGRFTDLKAFSYVCTAGGAMVRFLSGKKLPLIQAMENSSVR
ncbi:MAG: phosphoglycerate kinase [Spirochaetota bacterium]